MNKEHKYKDKDEYKDNDKDKDAERIIDFARRRFQTKFRLVWKILMTIVNVLKIPNQIQFGLEKSLTIANALNLEPIPVLLCKSHFKKGKH